MYITDYYEVIDMLEKLQNENEYLKSSINQMKTQFESIRKQYSGGSDGGSGSSLLNKMMAQAIKQCGKQAKGLRHTDPALEHFSLNVWILGGRKLYEIFNANFPAIFPSPTTIQRKLMRFDKAVDEGSLNVTVLKDYLITYKLPLVICLSEDATALVGRREYHAKTNRVVGFSLPLQTNGLPDASVSIAKTASDIIKQFQKYGRARYVT